MRLLDLCGIRWGTMEEQEPAIVIGKWLLLLFFFFGSELRAMFREGSSTRLGAFFHNPFFMLSS